jgi:hypothetical protein
VWSGIPSWAATLAVGMGLGLAMRACLCLGGGKGLWWAAALVGLAGAGIGRLAMDVAIFDWHSTFLSGAFGALILSLLWTGVIRLATSRPSR